MQRKNFFKLCFLNSMALLGPWGTNTPQGPLNEWLGHIAPALLKGGLNVFKTEKFSRKRLSFLLIRNRKFEVWGNQKV
jgi:hypothetical protein